MVLFTFPEVLVSGFSFPALDVRIGLGQSLIQTLIDLS